MTPSHAKQLGSLLRRHRAAAGLSLSEVGRQTGMPPSTVQRLERGEFEQPDPRKLVRLAEALDIEVEDLYGAAGLPTGTVLPGIQTYLRTKYGMSADAIKEAEAFFADLQEREGSGDAERNQ